MVKLFHPIRKNPVASWREGAGDQVHRTQVRAASCAAGLRWWQQLVRTFSSVEPHGSMAQRALAPVRWSDLRPEGDWRVPVHTGDTVRTQYRVFHQQKPRLVPGVLCLPVPTAGFIAAAAFAGGNNVEGQALEIDRR